MRKRLLNSLYALTILGGTLWTGTTFAQNAAQPKAAEAGKSFDLKGTPLNMARIPKGSFLMGSEEGNVWAQRFEFPRHQVTIPTDFYMGIHEVTQAQWSAVMPDHPTICESDCDDGYPVRFVSWDDIQPFLKAINAMGLPGTFRLPSEAEWEYAARGGTQTTFHFGESDCESGKWSTCGLDPYAWYCGNNTYAAHIVGLKLPNPFGLFDTMGNVWEWVQDGWHPSYAGAPADGRAWEIPGSGAHVLRGGYWFMKPEYCRPAVRYASSSSARFGSQGFRLAWTP